MKSRRDKLYTGFGFGPIQSALFLYEAYQTGNFSRFAVVDVDGSSFTTHRFRRKPNNSWR